MAPLLRALAAMLLFFAPAPAQSGEPHAGRDMTPMERWERLSPEEQERMRSRFERWQNLSEEERTEYKRRSEQMARARKEALRQLRKEDRERFEALDKPTQDSVLDLLTHGTLVERAERLRFKLPPEAQARLDGAEPEERKAILEELRRAELRKASDRAIEELARELRLSQAKVDELRSLPRRERSEQLLELKRRAIESGSIEGVRPDGMDQGAWERMRDLPPRDFARDLFRHRDRADMSRWDKRRRRIQEMITPTLDELIQVSRTPKDDRRATLERLVRTRIESSEGVSDKLPEGLLEGVRSASDREFINRLRRYSRPPHGGEQRPRFQGGEGRSARPERRPGQAAPPRGQGPRRPGQPGELERVRPSRDPR